MCSLRRKDLAMLVILLCAVYAALTCVDGIDAVVLHENTNDHPLQRKGGAGHEHRK
jgi:hypothetical protein